MDMYLFPSHSQHKLIRLMLKGGVIDENTVFVDFGHECAQFLAHLAIAVRDRGLSSSHLQKVARNALFLGIEADDLRNYGALSLLMDLLKREDEKDHQLPLRIAVTNASIEDLRHLERVTTVYMFAPVFIEKTLEKIAELVNASSTVQFVISTFNSAKMAEYGFTGLHQMMVPDDDDEEVSVEAKTVLTMSGGGQKFTFHLHERDLPSSGSRQGRRVRNRKRLYIFF